MHAVNKQLYKPEFTAGKKRRGFMFVIHKLRAEGTIDYAAQELKKYLFMMMPDVTDIKITID